MSLAYITGGQYVPMINAKLLAQVIVGGVREEITLERLMQSAQEDINREMQRAEAEGVDENEKIKRINDIFSSRNIRSQQMTNTFGAFTAISTGYYSKCADMNEMKHQFSTYSSRPTSGPIFGAPPVPGTSSLFGTSTNPAPTPVFGAPPVPGTSSLFGTSTNPAPTPVFGFGTTPMPGTSSVFGTSTYAAPTSGPIFGAPPVPGTSSVFGASTNPAPTSGFSFGAPPMPGTSSVFGASTNPAPTNGFTFGPPSVPVATGAYDSSVNMPPTDVQYANQTYELAEKDFSQAQATRVYQKWQNRHS